MSVLPGYSNCGVTRKFCALENRKKRDILMVYLGFNYKNGLCVTIPAFVRNQK